MPVGHPVETSTREEREAHPFGSQDWGAKPEVQIVDIKTEKALGVLASQWKNLRTVREA